MKLMKSLTDEASITLMDSAFNYPNISVLQGENRNFPKKTKVLPSPKNNFSPPKMPISITISNKMKKFV